MSVGGARERGTLNRGPFPTSHVPQNNLSRVSSSNHITRMKFADGYRHDWTLQNAQQYHMQMDSEKSHSSVQIWGAL